MSFPLFRGMLSKLKLRDLHNVFILDLIFSSFVTMTLLYSPHVIQSRPLFSTISSINVGAQGPTSIKLHWPFKKFPEVFRFSPRGMIGETLVWVVF